MSASNLAGCISVVILAAVVGCAEAESVDVLPGAAGREPVPGDEPRATAGAGGRPSSGSGGTDSMGPDFGEEPSTPMPVAERCDKVDFLYVVDNSASMVRKQLNLARSFVGFSRIVQETLGTNDHHIMVVDTDARNLNDAYVEGDSCTGKLGAGLVTGGEGQACGIDGSQRYMSDSQTNLVETFSCLAQVGVLGDFDEKQVEALLAGTHSIQSDLDGCNDGFLRDDAVLVVTIITDEDDDVSTGDPAEWKRALLATKNGNEQAIVMLGLVGDNNITGGLPGGPCGEGDAIAAPRLQSFVDSFELGSLGSVCAPDYSAFFARAVSVINTACDEFVIR